MLRAAVALLLLANALFFAWTQGWLGRSLPPPHQAQREPERLAAQVRPDAIRLVDRQAASAAAAAARAVCVEAGPFDAAALAAAEAALQAAGVPAGSWVQRPAPAPWAVVLGPLADAAVLKARQDELRRLKLPFELLAAPAGAAPSLLLSRHDDRESAETALAGLTAGAASAPRSVRSARVVALPPPVWLRVAKADAALQARLAALSPPALAAPFSACASR